LEIKMRVPFIAAALLIGLDLAATKAAELDCKDVKSIGSATMVQDGTLTLRLRSLPPGPIAEGVFTYAPDDPAYRSTIDHLGGIGPGQTKPVPPWC
jgi:hypothetical protein